jgi:DNA-binding beta-propeller fold protein YncE
VIRVARVDPRRRKVTAVISLPMRSNGNQLLSTPNAVWVTDPAEGPQSRIWRIDPATNRVRGEVPVDGRVTALAAGAGQAWAATSGPDALLRLPT